MTRWLKLAFFMTQERSIIHRHMDWTTLLGMAGVGFAAGTLGSMLGIGGGILIVPFLSLALHLPMHVAISASLASVIANSCAASTSYVRARLTNIRLGMLLSSTMAAGALAGALIAVALRAQFLSGLFGAVLIYAAYAMNRGQTGQEKTETSADEMATSATSLAIYYYDRSLQRVVYSRPTHIPLGLVASFFGGIIAGLLGIGGGIILVPLLNLLMQVPMKAAVATSSLCLGITAVGSCLVYYSQGYLHPLVVAPVVVGIFLGSQLGTRLAQRVPGLLLRHIFSVILLLVAIPMILEAFHIALPW